jgi:rare lipoprotein A
MRKSITALFLFSIVALVSSQSQITTNQKRQFNKVLFKVCSAQRHSQKTKVVVLQKLKDTVADMGELVLQKMLMLLVLCGQVSWKENCKWSTI